MEKYFRVKLNLSDNFECNKINSKSFEPDINGIEQKSISVRFLKLSVFNNKNQETLHSHLGKSCLPGTQKPYHLLCCVIHYQEE